MRKVEVPLKICPKCKRVYNFAYSICRYDLHYLKVMSKKRKQFM